MSENHGDKAVCCHCGEVLTFIKVDKVGVAAWVDEQGTGTDVCPAVSDPAHGVVLPHQPGGW